ncbi:MAG: hypothetical protein NTV34_09590 [Proteobacteria bacterium]|nr:hypothetical protein [Pseudomonadota bacterium]
MSQQSVVLALALNLHPNFTDLEPPHRYRLSSLECVSEGKWLILSTFNTGLILLSFGESQVSLQVDLPAITIKKRGGIEYRSGVALPIKFKLDVTFAVKQAPGTNHISANFLAQWSGSTKEWTALHCEQFGED